MRDLLLRFHSNLNTGSLDHLIHLLAQSMQVVPGQVVRLDFSAVRYIYPISACFLERIDYEVLRRGGEIRVAKLTKTSSALNQFFRMLSAEDDATAPTDRRIPTLSVRDILDASSESVGAIMDFFYEYIKEFTTGLQRAVSFPVTELLLNVIQHSECSSGNWICANVLPHKKLIRICVMDRGIGIKASLGKNPLYRELGSDIEAIRKCLEYGVTRYPDQTRGIFFDNLVKLIRHNGGSLDIISGSGRLRIEGDRPARAFELRVPYPGTIVSLKLIARRSYSPLLEQWESGVEEWVLP